MIKYKNKDLYDIIQKYRPLSYKAQDIDLYDMMQNIDLYDIMQKYRPL